MSLTQTAYTIIKERATEALDLRLITVQQYNALLARVSHKLAIVNVKNEHVHFMGNGTKDRG
jgi:hypothetical protein